MPHIPHYRPAATAESWLKGHIQTVCWAARVNERARLNTNPSFHLLNHALSPWFLARTGFFKEVREAGFLQCSVLPHHLPENGFHPPPAACPSRSQTRWEKSHFLRGGNGWIVGKGWEVRDRAAFLNGHVRALSHVGSGNSILLSILSFPFSVFLCLSPSSPPCLAIFWSCLPLLSAKAV